jgi:RNA polymerase sigma-70 factor (family 1)
VAQYSSLSDQELTVLLMEGDQAAYASIYDRFQGLLYIYACKITKDEDEAGDIVQDVFIYLWDKRAQIDFKKSIAAYLYSAVRYKFFNLLDHRRVRADYAASFRDFIDQGEYITDNYIREKEFTQLIEKEISALPSKMREIFELSRKAQLSHKEIAIQLDLSEKTVKNQVNNALKILRVKLGLYSFLVYILFYKR